MEKQKPFYWDFIKKDADLTFRSVFDFETAKILLPLCWNANLRNAMFCFMMKTYFLISRKKALPKRLSGK